MPVQRPVLCHNTLGPEKVWRGNNGRLIVVGWEHAGGQPPSWELGDSLMRWAIDPGGEVDTANARAMMLGYRSEANSRPPLDLAMFRGAVNDLADYVCEQVEQALNAHDGEDQRHADRSVRHLLSHLPSRGNLERSSTLLFRDGTRGLGMSAPPVTNAPQIIVTAGRFQSTGAALRARAPY